MLNDLGLDSASESNPVEITVLLTNPSFTDGSNGWEGEPSVDETLENAEKYSTNFNVYQTIKNLPAGAYEVRVKSYYRDGYLEAAYNHYMYEEDGGYQPNVKLYANDREQDVVSIANSDAMWTTRSYTQYTFWGTNPNPSDGVTYDVELLAWMEETDNGDGTYTVSSYQQYYGNEDNILIDTLDNAWIYDAWVTEDGVRYFYPNSMRGAGARFESDPVVYQNSVQVMIEEGEDLTLGLKKETTIDGDWCMMDDFQLFYLGTETPTAIEGIATSQSQQMSAIYSIDGRQNGKLQRGINIVKMADGTIKKVLIK